MFIYVLTGLARHADTQEVVDMVLAARIQDAGRAVTDALCLTGATAGLASAEMAILGGDLMLAQDRDEEAEELYRLAVKRAAAGPRGQVRIVSSRNTGFLSLFQQRYATAVNCFQRVAEDLSAGTPQRVEALCGLAIATHGIGLTQRSLHILDAASALAGERSAGSPLGMLVDMVRVELLVQREVRNQQSLHDHAFWRAPVHGTVAGAPQACSAREAIIGLLSAHGRHELVLHRVQYLQALLQAAEGNAAAMMTLPQHLAAMRLACLAACERHGRVDAALAAVAVGNADFARAILEPLSMRGGNGPAQRWSFELSYCLAKVSELSGRTAESLMHYQRYALETLQCVRTEWQSDALSRQSATSGEAATKDDVEMGLPAKYRRAYRYLLDHLDRSTLTVREIAEHIGVTERALQNVFRKHVGMTPAEVMRRRRVEYIRVDLLAEQGVGRTILEAGARWGICNRSTLVNSYRRHFDETPGQTLQRQRHAVPASL